MGLQSEPCETLSNREHLEEESMISPFVCPLALRVISRVGPRNSRKKMLKQVSQREKQHRLEGRRFEVRKVADNLRMGDQGFETGGGGRLHHTEGECLMRRCLTTMCCFTFLKVLIGTWVHRLPQNPCLALLSRVPLAAVAVGVLGRYKRE